MMMVSYKVSQALLPFTGLLCSPSEFSALVAADTPGSEAGRNLVRNVREFCLQYLFS
jgi:hypothetical protein